MIVTDLPFEEIWCFDFEYISKHGEHPDVLCLCAKELHSGQSLRLWDEQLRARPPYRTDKRVLFVCFAGTAECTCHLALGWPLPKNLLDLSPLFRCYINGKVPPAEGKGLVGAQSYFGLSTVGAKYKDAMRNRILAGRPFSSEERVKILDYCFSDIDGLNLLAEKLLPHFDLSTALHWGEFAAVSAVAEHRGVPINMAFGCWPFGSLASTFAVLWTQQRCSRVVGQTSVIPLANLICRVKPLTAWPKPFRYWRTCANCAIPAARCVRSSLRSVVTVEKQDHALAVCVENQPHTTESRALDFLPSCLDERSDQAGSTTCNRVHRLVRDGVPDCRGEVRLQTNVEPVRHRAALRRIRKTL
jgi:hypothetical protein